MKTCIACQKEKDRDEFYKHSKMADGLLGICKDCHKERVKAREERLRATDPKWLNKERKRCRIKQRKRVAAGLAKQPSNKAKHAWRKRNPEKSKAHGAVRRALRSGKLIRQRCRCGAPAQAHHKDYSKPLDVEWLCPKHHSIDHVKEREAKLLS